MAFEEGPKSRSGHLDKKEDRDPTPFTQCCKGSFLVKKIQILEKLEKWSIFTFVSKLTIFSVAKFEIFEFSRLNRSKIAVLFGQF